MPRINLDQYVTMGRRQVLRGMIGSTVLTVGAPVLSGCESHVERFDRDPFSLGIASGEPSPDGVVLWTNITPPPAQTKKAISVRWEIANDDRMIDKIQSGETMAHPDLGHAVHVEVDGL